MFQKLYRKFLSQSPKVFMVLLVILFSASLLGHKKLSLKERAALRNKASQSKEEYVERGNANKTVFGIQEYFPLLGESDAFSVDGIIIDAAVYYDIPFGEVPNSLTAGLTFSLFVAQAHKFGIASYWTSYSSNDYISMPDYGYEMRFGFLYNYLVGIKFFAIQMGMVLSGAYFTMNDEYYNSRSGREQSYIYVVTSPEINFSFRIFERFAFSIPIAYHIYFGGSTGDSYDLTHLSTGLMFSWMDLDLWI